MVWGKACDESMGRAHDCKGLKAQLEEKLPVSIMNIQFLHLNQSSTCVINTSPS